MSYACRYCDKVLATPGGLEIHEVSHEQAAPVPTVPFAPPGAPAPVIGAPPGGAVPPAPIGVGTLSPGPGPSARRHLGLILAAAVAVIAVVAGALVLTSRSGPSAFALVTRAPAKTLAARTAQVSETIDITPGPAQQAAAQFLHNLHADGVTDFVNHRAGLSFTFAGVPVYVVQDGTTIYENSEQFRQLTGGKSWIKLDVDSLGKVAGINGLGSLMQASYSDPGQGLQYLRGAKGPILTVAQEDVKGVPARHYRLTVSLAAAAAAMPAAQQATMHQIMDQFGVSSLPVDVWIDRSGVVRRVQETFDYSNAKPLPNIPLGSMPKSVEITIDYYGFGAAAPAQVPPAAEVADFGQILSQLPGGAGGGAAGSAPANPLEQRLLQAVPAGYAQQPDSVGDTGPSDLNKAVRDDGSSDARQVLTSDGFVAGYQRLWAKDSSAQIIDAVYQFDRPQGALSYMARTENEASGVGARSFAVTGVPGAYAYAVADSHGPVVAVFLPRGGYLAQIIIHGPDASAALASQLAQEQYQLLG